MIYRFRVVLDNDTDDDVFRDIEIRETDSLEDLHNCISQSFGFDGLEISSFYLSDDDWNEGEEITMFDTEEPGVRYMGNTLINEVVHEAQTKLIYVYDFLYMWTFFVELAEIVEEAEGTNYPNLMFVHGQIPESAPEKSFEAEDFDNFNDEFDDGLDIEDYDGLDFDENWN
jgi:hypothetical protein